MSHQNWLQAARKYANKPAEQQTSPTAPVTAVATQRNPGTSVVEIAAALRQFLHHEQGQAALTLLRASNRHVVIAEENDGGGYGHVYFLDGQGYKSSAEAMGTWQIYSTNVKKPEENSATSQEVAQAIVRASNGTATAEAVVSLLQKGLDAIAAQADK